MTPENIHLAAPVGGKVTRLPLASTVYTVQPGDTHTSIARRFYGDAGKAVHLIAVNGSGLVAGQTIRIP